jgi:hypothetical protein
LSPNRIGFRIPAECPVCAAIGSVVPEVTIHGESFVVLTWWCQTCSHEWLVSPEEQQTVERRKGFPDSRAGPRIERRGGKPSP